MEEIGINFETYLQDQIRRHPSAGPQDVVKQCYQAAFGAEHLLSDPEKAKAYLKKEYDAVKAQNTELYERISQKVCRINLAAWKYRELPWEWLFELFASSCRKNEEGRQTFEAYLEIAEKLVSQGRTCFSAEDWKAYLDGYKKTSMTAVHHSDRYREAERPAYRIVSSSCIRLLPVLEKAAVQSRGKEVCVIAIDGRAASGKSTMAQWLGRILGADIVHMDDFFLPLSLRTVERLAAPGGNVHYERFCEEVLPHLTKPQPFNYRCFNCSRMDYDGVRQIERVPFRIVEGSYSCHPVFNGYANLTVFSDVGPEEQLQRILKRNGAGMAQRFKTSWIPMEEQYFTAFGIAQRADVII